MPINAITFNIQEGGLGRAIPGKDYFSGIAFPFVDAQLPSGFGVADRFKKVFTLQEAEALGITSDSADDSTKIAHYHISEYFRMLGKSGNTGVLFINLFDENLGVYDGGQEVEDLQNFADGELRQVGVYYDIAFATSLVLSVNASITTLLGQDRPLIAILGADITGVADLSTLTDLRALDKKWVSVDISEDGSGVGAALAVSTGQSITSLGTTLGTIALSNVHENIGWVDKFDVADTIEFQEPAFANGDLVKDTSDSLINTLSTQGYLVLIKRQEITGTFYIDSPQTTKSDSDFAFIENARTMFKAVRLARQKLLPFINSPLYVDAVSGKLSEVTIFGLENAVLTALEQMAQAGEISVNQSTGKLPNRSVLIDPDQNVLATSKVVITVKIVPVGVAREIIINIGFVPKIG
ncbi:MAG: DUF2586 family protein [Nitrosopumilus sp.]